MSKISDIGLDELKKIIAESSSFKEIQIRAGYSPNSGRVRPIIEKYCQENNISLEHITNIGSQKVEHRTPENTLIKNSTASQATLRRIYEKGKYSEYKCAICGQLPFWNGKPLTLTLDHINGLNTDDRIENLRWVCPNCDRQLDTFGSKNCKNLQTQRINQTDKHFCKICGKPISSQATFCQECFAIKQRVVERPSVDKLQQMLLNANGNFCEVGRMFNVADNTIRKWCKQYNLPTHSADYKVK